MLAGDPLFGGGVDGAVVLIVLLKTGVAFVALMVSVLFMVWFERKVVSDMQNRIGPNRAGPWGILQTLADGIKLFFKEDLLPDQADRRIFRLAPYLSIVPAFLAFAVVPLGGVVTIAGRTTRLQLADPPIGILFLLAMSSVAVYGVMLAGWSSGSKYPLLGSVRASAQMVSYEAALGLSVAAVVLVLILGGGDAKKSGSASTASTASTATTTTGGTTQVVAQVNFKSPNRNGKALGVGQVVRRAGQPGVVIQGQGLAQSSRSFAYAVWLYNSRADARRLGFVNPGVGKDGRLVAVSGLPANASRFRNLIVTRETSSRPKRPGAIVLIGKLSLSG